MILLCIGIILCVLAVVFLRKTHGLSVQNFRTFVYAILGAFIFAGGVLSLLFGLFVPFAGYEEPQLISTTEATCISYEEEDIFVFYDSETVLFYIKYEVINIDGKEYEMKPQILSRDEIEIIPEKDCKMPRIEKYLVNGKSSYPWALAKQSSKTQYKLYVPESTIWKVQD